MLYVVRFYDRTDRLTVRDQFLRAHVAWLDEHREQVLIGGSLRDAPGIPPVGGLWLVEAQSKAAVEELMKTDPFWVNGLRERYEIFFWSKAFPERKVPV
jgi:uncharacterized protein YciI